MKKPSFLGTIALLCGDRPFKIRKHAGWVRWIRLEDGWVICRIPDWDYDRLVREQAA